MAAKLIKEIFWSGNLPGYADSNKLGSVISVPNEQKLVLDPAFGPTSVHLPEKANWVCISEGGKWAWQGVDSGVIYEGLVSTHKQGYGQFSFIYVGEELRIFTDVKTFQDTAGGWWYVDEKGQIVGYGSKYTGSKDKAIPFNRTEFADGTMIGQGPDDNEGVVMRLPGETFFRQLAYADANGAIHRVVGDSHNIRVRRYADLFVITVVYYSQHVTRVYRATMADLKACPTLYAQTPPVIIQPPPVLITANSMQAFDRKMWVAPFFSHSERYGMTATADHVGNAIMITEDMTDAGMAKVFALGFPMIIGSAQVNPSRANTTIAYWTGDDAGAQEALANPIEKPVLWYKDVGTAGDWPASRPSWVNEKVWPTIQAYRTSGETLETFENRIRGILDRVKTYGRPMVLVPRFDDFNGSGSVTQTLECMPVYVSLVRDYEIIGFLPFADRRGNGISSNPSLRDWAMSFKLAVPTRPNRFDYWQPTGTDMVTLLKNKFGQSTLLIALTDVEKAFILKSLQAPVTQPDTPTDPPTTTEWPNLQGILAAERAKYPAMVTADQCVAIINAVAAQHPGLGLLKKSGGNHGLQPKSGIPCSVDWVIMKDGRGADVLGDGGNIDGTLGKGSPNWPSKPSDDVQDPSKWVAPTA